MTIVSNVKGYINGEDWGVVENIDLKSYDEIIEQIRRGLGYNAALNELNLYSESYYDKFLSEGHLSSGNYLSDDGTNPKTISASNIKYNGTTRQRTAA